MTSSWTDRLLSIAPSAASFLVYIAVVGNGFYADDFGNLYHLVNGPLHLEIVEPHAGHWLISFNVLFATFHALFGMNSALYFLVMVLVHCANVRLVQSILVRTTGWPYLAAFGAALFGICPINVGSLGWLSVLGHVVATTAVLVVVRDLVRVQQEEIELDGSVLARAALLLLIAASSFGIGLGIAVGFGGVLFLWNPDPKRRTGPVLAMLSLGALMSLIYLAAGPVLASEHEATYVEYLPHLPANMLRLLSVGMGSLLGGPLVMGKISPISDEWRFPVMFAIGAVGFAAVGLAFALGDRTLRRRVLALGFLVCCGYGVVALGRWFLLVDPKPIPRYHYLGPAIFSLLLGLACRQLFAGVRWPARRTAAIFYGWLAVAIVPCALAVGPADDVHRLDYRERYHAAVTALEEELERGPGDEEAIALLNEPVFVSKVFGIPYTRFPDRAALFVLLYDENRFEGVPVRFIEPDPDKRRMLLEAQVEGSRMSGLLAR